MYISPDLPSRTVREMPGNQSDLRLLEEDTWLINTEVRYHLQEKKSRWHLTMVYVAVENPMKLICRKIDAYPSEKKALTYALILQRGIRKDARGALKTNHDALHLCNN